MGAFHGGKRVLWAKYKHQMKKYKQWKKALKKSKNETQGIILAHILFRKKKIIMNSVGLFMRFDTRATCHLYEIQRDKEIYK